MGNKNYEKVFTNVLSPRKSGSGAQTYVGKRKKPTPFLDPYRVLDAIKAAANKVIN